ncbi:MAG TPA: FkbM family methyltransferase [Candidatus Limnocylindria bacterium]|nr:FkbM family methyltransferase [Candidatus Limnocylindria bacterium]
MRDHLTLASRLKYFLWRTGVLGSGPIVFQHKDGPRLLVRPDPAGDLITAYEVFVSEIYRPPWKIPADSIRYTVDIGSNIGLSAAYLGRAFPQSKLALFEPHPVHVALLKSQLAANGLTNRAEIFPVAVGAAAGSFHLTDEGTSSTLSHQGGSGTIPVTVIDWLDWAQGRSIDYLKVDAEGAEYPLFFDLRMEGIKARYVVVEWHRTEQYPNGKELMLKRLQALGYETEPGVQTSDLCGLIWGRRR